MKNNQPIEMTGYKPIDRFCQNCRVQLEARPLTNNAGFVVSGFEPMEFRHIGGYFRCIMPPPPELVACPYNAMGTYDLWKKAKQPPVTER